NTKFLGKTLVASALVLTTLGTGLHSSYLGLDTNKVVKTAKAEENMTTGQLWKKVKDSLIDSNIILGNEHETIDVTYLQKSGSSSKVSAPGNSNEDFLSHKADFARLTTVDIDKKNIPPANFNDQVDANTTWNTLSKQLKSKGLVKDGDTLTIHTSENNIPKITSKVGDNYQNHKGLMLNKRDINKITIE
ncbi:TPA: DUF4888 domain-containing protein, partial [Staphylococcus aureus]|nr:DUF4888 domain-containing protein [Staphylococcus aureus]